MVFNNTKEPATQEVINRLIEDSVASVLNNERRNTVITRMRAGLIVDPAKDDTAEIAEVWRKCEEASAKVSQADFDKKHAAFLRDLVCDAKESRDAHRQRDHPQLDFGS